VMPLACLGFVAIAIHLDDKPCGQADKIHDIWSDRRLTPEFQVSCFPEFPQFIPEKRLCLACRQPKRAGLLAHFEADASAGHQNAPRHQKRRWSTAETTPPGRFAATLPSRGREASRLAVIVSPPMPHTLSMMRSPNRPCGRKSSTISASTKANHVSVLPPSSGWPQ